jgi:GxxExxY protein
MIQDNPKHFLITSQIIRAYYNVYNRLGFGFLEKVYERAMLLELKKLNLVCASQQPIEVFYDDERIGLYYADIVVNNCVIIEIKAAETLSPDHEAQLTNYLKATEFEVGILLNFGKITQIKRKVYSNTYKDLNDLPK